MCIGLIFSHRFVDLSLFTTLVTHLTKEWKHTNQAKAATIVNLYEGTLAVFQILFAFVADAYTGLYFMVISSTTLYISGLWIYYTVARHKELFVDHRLLYTALGLISLSQAAKSVTLEAFLGDQVSVMDQRPTTKEEEERAKKRCKFWWMAMFYLASIVVMLWTFLVKSFLLLVMVSAIVMDVAFVWFLLGARFYSFTKPTGSPLSDVASVIFWAIAKRNLEYPETPEQLFQNSTSLVQILPHVPWLRWLDKAAIVVEDKIHRYICSVEQVTGVKFLLKMLPMWATFLTFSMVVATGSTFFLQEAININHNFPVLVFIVLQKFVGSYVGNICDKYLERLCERKKNIAQKMMLVRIGFGMTCCVLCCITAWAIAKKIRVHPERHMSIFERYMSIFALTPQYILLGTMEGLSVQGLKNFFDSQVPKSLTRYDSPFGECVLGIGKFLSALSVIILGKWFTYDIYSSHLDKYYIVLVFLSSANLIIYVFVAAYSYGDEKFLAVDQVDIETVGLLDTVTELQDTLPLLSPGGGQQTAETEDPVIIKASFQPSSSFPPSGPSPFLQHPSSRGMYRRMNTMR